MIIDSHCHLDYPIIYNQLDNVLKRAELNNIKFLLTICTTLESFKIIEIINRPFHNLNINFFSYFKFFFPS